MGEVRLGVLVSGSGTILEAILDAGLEVSLVVADRACRGLDVARDRGVASLLVDRHEFGGFSSEFHRDEYSRRLADELVSHGVTLVAMAGFGTVTTGVVYDAFPGRVLNTHPSLLPAFKGWHAVAQALEAGVGETGCTVHVATEKLDDGPILAQRRVAVLASDDESTLHERIKTVERSLYPLVLGRVMTALSHGEEPVTVAEMTESD